MPVPVPDAQWHCKPTGAYNRNSDEAFENAICTYNLLNSLGWSISAICGVWGNIEAESGYNPWRWQSDNVLNSNDTITIAESTLHGYGLVQFTPAGKYIYAQEAQTNAGYGPNFSNEQGSEYDGDSQFRYINDYADYIATASYPLSYADFKINQMGPEYSAVAWLLNYERPYDQGQAVQDYRASIARYWYDILIQYDPSDPIGPDGSGRITDYSKPFKFMFYLKPHYKKRGF